VSDDVVVMTGKKDARAFEPFLEGDIKIFADDWYLSTPLGGIISGLGHVKHAYTALLGCDAPLVKAEVIDYLFEVVGGHVAAVPIWEKDDVSTMQPLCAVYRVAEAKKAALQALHDTRQTVKRMVTLMPDVLFVGVPQLRQVDPSLDSFVDVNTRDEYSALENRTVTPVLVPGTGSPRRRRGRGG